MFHGVIFFCGGGGSRSCSYDINISDMNVMFVYGVICFVSEFGSRSTYVVTLFGRFDSYVRQLLF